MIRAVLDANVFVSALLTTDSPPAKILDAWHARHLTLVVSPEILAEIGRIIRYPKIRARHKWSEARLALFMRRLRRLTLVTPGYLRVAVVKEDPDDDKYLACALEGDAEHVVTGDRHLLRLGQYQRVRILAARAFLEILPSESPGKTQAE